MTKERQWESLHWFMNIAVQRRVLYNDADNNTDVTDIMDVPTSAFLPSREDLNSLDKNMAFHIIKVATKNIDCLKKYIVPDHIIHPYISELSKQSTYFIVDLLDKSENKAEDMMSIFEEFYPASVIEKIVFGGDVLTNERAHTAQLNMLNGEPDFYRLDGVIHRPEGLHRMMNFLLFIYQEFYKCTSATDQLSLYQLRNSVRRVDVSGPDKVVDSFRAHHSFVEDCLDAYIMAAVMDILGISKPDGHPTKFTPPPLLELNTDDNQYRWLESLAFEVLDKHVKLDKGKNLTDMASIIQEMDDNLLLISEMFDKTSDKYICSCNKKYKTVGHFKTHLTKEHNWEFNKTLTKTNTDEDHVAIYRASFMKNALILRDTYDAYKHGDGDRIFRNAKFEILCASVANHYKYKLWLWRLQANILAENTKQQAFEYKWNCTSSLTGGIGDNIPNDNLVEIMVQLVKKNLKQQGANFTFKSAQKSALSVQIQESIKLNITDQVLEKTHGKKRTRPNKFTEVQALADELINGRIFEYLPGRKFDAFQNIKDVFARVNITNIHKYIKDQKETLSFGIVKKKK